MENAEQYRFAKPDKVLGHLKLKLKPEEMKDLASAKPECIEVFLLRLKSALENYAGNGNRRVYQEHSNDMMKNYNLPTSDEKPKKSTTLGFKNQAITPSKR